MATSELEPTLLLVDDRPANLLALEAVLEPLGVPMVNATSGEDALRYLLHLGERIALILLDVQMPGLDGFETAALIRARPLLQHVPIIFITAINREEAHIVKGYAHGAVDYVVKPFDPDTLRAKVRQFVAIHRRQMRLEQDKRNADARTHESEQRLRLALDAAQLGTWAWDGTTGIVTRDGRAAELFEPEVVVGDTSVVSVAQPMTDTDGRFRFEYRTPQRCWLEIQGRAYRRPDGTVEKIFGTAEDISTRKREQEQRELFLGALGHDLRNPLNAISMASQLLSRRPDPDVALLGTRVQHGAQRMTSLINDLLEFVRSRSGALPVDVQLTNAADVCRDVIAEVEAAHPGTTISFATCGDAEGCWDPARLGQIIQNLVTNAVRHAAPGTTARVEIRDEGDDVAIDVENQGEPIPPNVRSRMFEPLVSGVGGLGLGLYIANQLAIAHHGRIDVSSENDRTRFRVVLPRRRDLHALTADQCS